MKEIALLGGGGLAIEILDYMQADGIKPVGYYSPTKDDFLSGILPWLGDERINFDERLFYMIASGYINIRQNMINFIEEKKIKVYTFKSSRSYVSSFAKIGEGSFIGPYSAITGNPVIGKYLLANLYSCICHHSIVGDNVVLGPGAKITGRCKVDNNVFMGINSSLLPESIIGSNVDIGINTFPNNRTKIKMNTSIIGKYGIAIPKM